MIDWDHTRLTAAFDDWESFCMSEDRGVTVTCRYVDVPPQLPDVIESARRRLEPLIPDLRHSRPFNGPVYYLRLVHPELREGKTERPGCILEFGPSDYRTFIATSGMEDYWAKKVLPEEEWAGRQAWVDRWTKGRSYGEVSPFFCHGFGINILVTIPNPDGPGRLGLFAERPAQGAGAGFVAVSAGLTVTTVDEGIRPGEAFDQRSADDLTPDLDRAFRRGLEEEFGYKRSWPLGHKPVLLDVGLVRSVHQSGALYHLPLDITWEQARSWIPHAQDVGMEVASSRHVVQRQLFHRVLMTRESVQDFVRQQKEAGGGVCSWAAVLALRVLGPNPPTLTLGEERFDVALSFAGEDRARAEELRDKLVAKGITVFYDMDYEHELWGEDLYSALARIYEHQARYCIIFVSRYYKLKEWTNLELRHALARLLEQRSAYVLPIMIDDTQLDGIPPTMGRQDLRQKSIDQIARLVIRKLKG